MKDLVPYRLRVEAHRTRRGLRNLRPREPLARTRAEDPSLFPFELAAHSSKLIRKVDPRWAQLQENKVRNLELACARIDRLAVRPGEVFSFCSAVGRTSRRRGYLDGLEMRDGDLLGAPGGGLCQLANLIFWLAIHVDLDVVERHRHEEDLFPDDERRVPFGMGATVFYNYLDLRFRNTLPQPLLLRVSVRRPLLCGSLLSTSEKVTDVEVYETEHRFLRRTDGSVWRENRVVKRVTYHDGRLPLEVEIAHNLGRVRYELPDEQIEHAAP